MIRYLPYIDYDSILIKCHEKDSNIEMLILVSESPKVRSNLEKEFTRALIREGVDRTKIKINIQFIYIIYL